MINNSSVNALLISSSKCGELDYFEHVRDAIAKFLGPPEGRFVAFAPFAGVPDDYRTPLDDRWEMYANNVEKYFQSIGFGCVSLHKQNLQSIQNQNRFFSDKELAAVFCGGGNTFQLLHELRKKGLDDAIQMFVRKGVKYIGASAGSVVAGMSIGTTNDMFILDNNRLISKPRKGLTSLRIINCNINAHYYDGLEFPKQNSETRDQRIREFHYYNRQDVIGIREPSWLRVQGEKITMRGGEAGQLFKRGKEVETFQLNYTKEFR